MGRETSSEGDARSNGRRGDNTIHPLEINPTAPPPPRRRGGRDDFRPFRTWFPWLVPLFVVANIALFVVAMYINDCPEKSQSCVLDFLGRFSFQPLKENPLFGPSSSTVLCLEGSKFLFWMFWVVEIFYYVDMDKGCQSQPKNDVEVRIGPLYVIAGFGGSLLSALFIRTSISVGASGALFGLLGAMLSELITNWTIYANKFAALLTLVIIIAINLAVGILPHVDNFAHVGGFITGFFLGFVILIRPQFGYISQKNAPLGRYSGSIKRKHKMYQYVLWIIAAIALIVGFAVGLVMLFRGVNANEHCSWCHYLSCVPTSKWSCKAQSKSCLTSQSGRRLNLTCQDNGKSKVYDLSSMTGAASQIYDLETSHPKIVAFSSLCPYLGCDRRCHSYARSSHLSESDNCRAAKMDAGICSVRIHLETRMLELAMDANATVSRPCVSLD
ncbi:RHOMBOID-like protein 1 [Cocos nucifera]|uniref:RHOMBOID-like protein n=1 Tax=Cocos nucifera TaxID=13894 RepID=A0A8K0IZ29_COCNU|nr:RHOMBOID-like protein 1 [Cocos nucifera]